MERLYEKMAELEFGLYDYMNRCEDYWNDIGRWQPKAKDIFKFANAFKRLAAYKPQRPISLEERAELTQIQHMMAIMAALIETCALDFPNCNIEDDFWDARAALDFWLEGDEEDNDYYIWGRSYEEHIFQKYREAIARSQAEDGEEIED